MTRNIAFVTYETPYSPGGGIAAVMAYLPRAIQELSKNPVFVISPFHFNITKTKNSEPAMIKLATISVSFDGKDFDLDVMLLDKEVKWIFLKSKGEIHQDTPFFGGELHPYDVQPMTSKGHPVLKRDSLFFGKAVSQALPELTSKKEWIVLMQDWEAATTALVNLGVESENPDIAQYLTIHNTYDSGISGSDLLQINPESEEISCETVLECALPLIHDPVFTVSEQFALDLSSEILQTKIMIPHLISALTPRLIGVNNGPFVQSSVPEKALASARTGNYGAIHAWKAKNRELAFAAVDEIRRSEQTPIWGNRAKFDREEAPWFVMAGRDDSRQKGYEIACLAIDELLSKEMPARFLFFPIPGDEGLPGIEFIHDLAKKYPHKVICFPFLFKEGFFAVMRGATYGIMPSYYEPFGMANEYYLTGVVCIGRATGGITQQIVPYRQASSFKPSVKRRADLWHKSNRSATGFLFRELDDIPSSLEDWHAINEADYDIGIGISNRLHTRSKLPTVQSMASELASTIEDANQLFFTNQQQYYDMLVNGIDFISSNFSWKKTAKSYLDHIKP